MSVKRAPRLAPDERIAPYVTRRGRFVARDPLISRRLPSKLKLLGVAGWAALTAYAFRRAYQETRAQETRAEATRAEENSTTTAR